MPSDTESPSADGDQHRRIEDELRGSDVGFRTFVDHATDAFILVDDQGTILDVNRQACDSLGYTRKELIGTTVRSIDAGLDERSVRRVRKRMTLGETVTFETRHRRKDGTTFPVEVRGSKVESGTEQYLFLARDITERKRRDERAMVQHAITRIMAEASSVDEATPKILKALCECLACDVGVAWRMDREAGLLRCADVWRMPSVEAAQFETATRAATYRLGSGLPGKVWASRTPLCVPNVVPASNHLRAEIAAREGLHAVMAFPILLGTHVLGVIEFVSREIRPPDQDLLDIMAAIGSQIGQFVERKRSERALRENEARLEEAQRLASLGWWERDLQSNQVFLSDELCRIFGLSPVPLPDWHRRWIQLIHPEDRSRIDEAVSAAVRGGPRYDVEYRLIRPDGRERTVHSRGDVTWDAAGRPLRLFGVLQDITELRQAERELRASETRFRTFVDHATDGFFILDDHLKVLDVNRQACENLGYSREELVGMHPRDFDIGLNPTSVKDIRQRIAAGERLTFETLHRRKDGTVVPVEISASQFDQQGRHLCLVRDITDRKRAEKAQTELAHVTRVVTMSALTSSIAHEISQPIAATVGDAGAALRFLSARPPKLELAFESLNAIIANGSRAGEVVGRIRDLIKKAPPRRENVKINDAVREVVELAKGETVKNGVSVRIDLGDSLPTILADWVQLQQVLLNLIVNAIEAMSKVTERTRELHISTDIDATGNVLITSADTGVGIDATNLDRIFEHFYTTKPNGLGMGLAICQSIIDAHGGRIRAAANKPYGAIFQITLPSRCDES